VRLVLPKLHEWHQENMLQRDDIKREKVRVEEEVHI